MSTFPRRGGLPSLTTPRTQSPAAPTAESSTTPREAPGTPRPLLHLGNVYDLAGWHKGKRVLIERTPSDRAMELSHGVQLLFLPPNREFAQWRYAPGSQVGETWPNLVEAYARRLFRPDHLGWRPIELQRDPLLVAVSIQHHYGKRGPAKPWRVRNGDAIVDETPPPGSSRRKGPSLLQELAVGLTRAGWDVELYGQRLTGADPIQLGQREELTHDTHAGKRVAVKPPVTVYTRTVYAESGATYDGLGVSEEIRQMQPLNPGRRAGSVR